jgi:WD40 repeat protein
VLSNALNWTTAGGVVDGATHSLELPYANPDFSIPSIGSSGSFSVTQLSSQAMTADIYTLGWSYGGQYLLAGSDVGTTELQLYYFDGATLTATTMTPAGGVTGRYVNSVRWAYDDNYVLAALAAGTGNDVLVYYKRVNGGFTLLSGVDLAAEARVGRWHQSGKFIAVGTDGGAVRTYPFSRATGLIGALTSSVTLASAVSYNTMDFAPGGNFIVTGISTGNQLQVLSVTGGGVLATSTSISPGAQVTAVDWCSTGTYIAVGLQAGTQNLRVYAHDVATASLTEVVSCRVDEAKTVYAAYWDSTGNFLAAGMTSGTGPEVRLFYFDRTKLRLIEIYRIDGLNTVWAIRWHPGGRFLAYGQTTNYLVSLLGVLSPSLLIDNLSMILNTDTSLYLPLQVKGNCKINGRGKRLTLQTGSEIVVRPGASLIIEDTELAGVGGSNVRCLTDAANLTLCQCQLDLAKNLTFSRGALLLQETVALTGTNAFIYTSGGTCTLDTLATLYVDIGTTLQYAPNRPRRDLLYFTDPSSVLYLNNCSLTASRTGPLLTGGTLIFDNGVTLSSQALYAAERMSLASTMTIDVRSGANVSLYGYIGVD